MGIAPERQQTTLELMNGLLDKGYTRAAGATIQAITRSDVMDARLRELDAEAARLKKEGLRMSADNPVARALIADFEDAMRKNAQLVDRAASGVQQSGIDAAGPITRQLAIPGVTDKQLETLGIKWGIPNPRAVNQLVRYAESSAWEEGLEKYQSDAVRMVRDAAIRGSISGWGPEKTAREIRGLVEGIPANVANAMMRTLQLTSLRDAQVMHRMANAAILRDQIRLATLDDRTCMACIALHGKHYPLEQRIDDHWNGRCTSITVLKRDQPPNIQSGQMWFNSLSPAQQRAHMGDAAYEAWKAGKVQLSEFAAKTDDPVFGSMVREASLSGLLGKEEAQKFYGAGAANAVIAAEFDIAKPYEDFTSAADARRWAEAAGVSAPHFTDEQLALANEFNRGLDTVLKAGLELPPGMTIHTDMSDWSGYTKERLQMVPAHYHGLRPPEGAQGLLEGYGHIALNPEYDWSKHAQERIEYERVGWWSSGEPSGTVVHEIGHAIHHYTSRVEWSRDQLDLKEDAIAGKVSRYAQTNAKEFVAETFTGLVYGKEYDDDVMGLYQSLGGPEVPK